MRLDIGQSPSQCQPSEKLTDRDRAYRPALGLSKQGKVPPVIGTQSSA